MNELNSIVVKLHGKPSEKTTEGRKYGERWFHCDKGYFCLPRPLRGERKLTNLQFRVLIVIASHVFTNDTVWLSGETIRELSGISEGSISKATTKLHSLGWLKKKRRYKKTNIYTLTLPTEYQNHN